MGSDCTNQWRKIKMNVVHIDNTLVFQCTYVLSLTYDLVADPDSNIMGRCSPMKSSTTKAIW